MKTKKITKTKLAVIASTTALCAIFLGGCSGGIGGKTINLDDYVTVTFDGYNGYGTAKVELDTDAIDNDYASKIDVKADDWYYSDSATVGDVISDWAGVALDESSGLSNGDTVALDWDVYTSSIEKYVDCKVTYSDKEYEVEGLEDIGTVNIFDGVEVSYTGYSPVGDVTIKGNDYTSCGTFSCENETVSNGDEITVKYEYSSTGEEGFIKEFGAIPESLEKTYTVSGLDSYVENFSDLSEDNLNTLMAEAMDQVEAAFTSENHTVLGFEIFDEYVSSGQKGDDYTLENVYFLKAKEASYASSYGGYYSAPVFVYSVAYNASDSINATSYEYQGRAYYVVAFQSLILEESGNIVGTSSSTTKLYSSADEAYSTWVTSNKDNFNIEIYDADLNLQE